MEVFCLIFCIKQALRILEMYYCVCGFSVCVCVCFVYSCLCMHAQTCKLCGCVDVDVCVYVKADACDVKNLVWGLWGLLVVT